MLYVDRAFWAPWERVFDAWRQLAAILLPGRSSSTQVLRLTAEIPLNWWAKGSDCSLGFSLLPNSTCISPLSAPTYSAEGQGRRCPHWFACLNNLQGMRACLCQALCKPVSPVITCHFNPKLLSTATWRNSMLLSNNLRPHNARIGLTNPPYFSTY